MATAASSWACHYGYEIVAETNTNKTIRVTAYWKNINWTYNINGVSAWVYCNGEEKLVKDNGSLNATSDGNGSYPLGSHDFVISKTTAEQNISFYAKITSKSSYVSGTKYSDTGSVKVAAKPYHTITYDVTGGSGTPSSQIKWYNETITLSSVIPVKTGHTFVNWCTNTTGTGTKYNPGDEYSSNANMTLYAIWSANTYTVSYNANGGTGAPANQTKTYGVNLTLSSTKPTRTNYNFLGWSTSADGGVVYNSGGVYSANAATTLYAVWEIAYLKPRINNFTATRCNSSGTITESGTYVKVTFDWVTDKTVSGIKIEWKTQTGTTWSNSTVSASGTSGSVSKVIGSGNISTDTTYLVKASVSDSGGTTPSPTITIGTIKYPIDVKKGGKGVAICKAAETDDLFDVAISTKIDGDLEVLGDISSTGSVSVTGDVSTSGSISSTGDISTSGAVDTTNGYKQNGVLFARHGGVNTIISGEDGGNIYLRPNGDSSDTGRVLIKNDGTITTYGGAVRLYGAKVLYNNATGSNGSITLSDSASNYDYLEIFYTDNQKSLIYSVKVQTPNGKSVGLNMLDSWVVSGTAYTDIKTRRVLISDKTISTENYNNVSRCSYLSFRGTAIDTHSNTNYIYITKVVGYM